MQEVVQKVSTLPKEKKVELLKFMQSGQTWFPKPECNGEWVEHTSSPQVCQVAGCGKMVNNFDDGALCSNGGHRICWKPCLFKSIEWEKMKQEEKEIRLLMLRLDNAGKTTILKKFNGEPVDTVSPTLGFNIKTLEYEGYKLNIWDVGGQKTIRSYWRNYFEATDGLVWVVDSADKGRLADCRDELSGLLQEERLAGATLLIFANKQDLPGALSASEIRDFLGLEEIKRRHWCILACSAYTGEGLLEGIRWLVSDISSRVFLLD